LIVVVSWHAGTSGISRTHGSQSTAHPVLEWPFYLPFARQRCLGFYVFRSFFTFFPDKQRFSTMSDQLPIVLDRECCVPLRYQLYEQLRRLIVAGEWKPGYKLPSTRELSETLSISRPTINWAYLQLTEEGYLESFAGSGTFVSRELPEELLYARETDAQVKRIQPEAKLALSSRGAYLLSQGRAGWSCADAEHPIIFANCQPSLSDFPLAQWRKLQEKHYGQSTTLLGYPTSPKGYYPLREAIAHYLFRARAIQCSPEQVIVVSGAQQALDLAAKVHIDAGDSVAFEDPGYQGARRLFQSYGAQLWPIPVDESGLQFETLAALDTIDFKLLFLNPSHQTPLGSTLSLERRLKITQWAQQTGTMIVEDDFDGEYRYCGRPIPALYALDKGRSVLYVGTFSKALFPALRIGYIVVPERLIEVYAWAKQLSDNFSPLPEQCVLADFINNGDLEKHIRRMRKIYEHRRQVLVDELQEQFGDSVSILGECAGLFLAVRFKTDLDDRLIIEEAATLGVGLRSTREDYLAGGYINGEFILNFGHLDEQLIKEGVKRIANVISHLQQSEIRYRQRPA
jgi:GntR family transcriptional regulator/MocR family aminotransferase